jgi:hypothetical protein
LEVILMAEGDITTYNHGLEEIMRGHVEFDADTFKVVLLGSGYSFLRTGNNGYANISAQEITAAGYSAGGETLAGLTVVQNDTANNAKWDATDVTWTSLATTTIAHLVCYDDTITATVADPLIFRMEIGTNSNGGDYSVIWNASGILVLS